MSVNNKRVAVIGSGVGGLSAAIRLASKGYEVDVFEANSFAGGKLSEVWVNGYRFDVGPSVMTLPHLFDELARDAGLEPHVAYERLEMTSRYQFEDGLVVNAWADPERFFAEIADKFAVDAAVVRRHFAKSKRAYELTLPVFLERSLHKLASYLSIETLRAFLLAPTLSLFSSLHQLNARSFADPRLQQLFDRYATFNGSDPYLTPGVMSVISYIERGLGVFAPQGGMIGITQALVAMAEKKGVRLHLNSKVTALHRRGKRVSALTVQKGTAAETLEGFDAVVSNLDVVLTYRNLLGDDKTAQTYAKQERSLSAIVFCWGIRPPTPGALDGLEVHNSFFSRDYADEFDHLKRRTVSEDPTIYLNITSRYAPGDAPPGCDTWFAMVNVPANDGSQDWDAEVRRMRRAVIAKLSRNLGLEVEPMIEAEWVLDPRVIEERYATWQGSIYGTASNSRTAGFFRHPNFSPKYEGLYFAGTTVHPGGGIPLCLLSGKIASELVVTGTSRESTSSRPYETA